MMRNNYQLREITFDQWNDLWITVDRTNILQSWHYGEAKKESERMEVAYFAVYESDNPVSIAQVLIKKLPLKLSLARINRAPLVLNSQPDDQIVFETIKLIIDECKIRWWIMLQIAPELENKEQVETNLSKLGLKKLKNPPWASALIDLQQDDDALLSSLNGKWRNCLRKGWKNGVKTELNQASNKNVVKDLVSTYKSLQKKKSFIGLSSDLILSMASRSHSLWSFNIFSSPSMEGEGNQGMLVSVHHGDTAIYLIGSSTNEGRKNQINYVLLWAAIKHAKLSECKYYDIGGLDETTPRGIAHFKKGLNAVPYKLTGEWRGFFIPKILQ
ncbi:MAG: hypothetical protein CMD06_00155 [Flavobacteriales bacterium]|nr:hypothetical protein [Flavobacteriales bacterium]|tara:strand:+ start:251 stop:1237 length:987 start_codon:yes stop_codon:yes gene_type:complete